LREFREPNILVDVGPKVLLAVGDPKVGLAARKIGLHEAGRYEFGTPLDTIPFRRRTVSVPVPKQVHQQQPRLAIIVGVVVTQCHQADEHALGAKTDGVDLPALGEGL
jgi:hypothetical protein